MLSSGPDGIADWNEWRTQGDDPPFLSAANLRGADLRGADLRFVSLALARLDGADLSDADLSGASLRQADLFDSTLSRAVLVNTDARAADFSTSNLSSAVCRGADFAGADLNGSTLAEADLTSADMTGADFANTDLTGVNLRNARLIGTRMDGARLTRAEFAGTVISCGLAGVTDLELTVHHLPSPIAVSSILLLTGPAPVGFLRGCGLRPEEIEHFTEALAQPVRINACFLTYHEADEDLANRIHRDLQDAGIRCWKRRHRRGELEVGESGEIERMNCGVNRVVLLASRESLNSPSILREIGWALRQEEWRRERAQSTGDTEAMKFLFPVEIDDYARNGWTHPYREGVMDHSVADAESRVSDTDVYRRVLGGLLEALGARRA